MADFGPVWMPQNRTLKGQGAGANRLPHRDEKGRHKMMRRTFCLLLRPVWASNVFENNRVAVTVAGMKALRYIGSVCAVMLGLVAGVPSLAQDTPMLITDTALSYMKERCIPAIASGNTINARRLTAVSPGATSDPFLSPGPDPAFIGVVPGVSVMINDPETPEGVQCEVRAIGTDAEATLRAVTVALYDLHFLEALNDENGPITHRLFTPSLDAPAVSVSVQVNDVDETLLITVREGVRPVMSDPNALFLALLLRNCVVPAIATGVPSIADLDPVVPSPFAEDFAGVPGRSWAVDGAGSPARVTLFELEPGLCVVDADGVDTDNLLFNVELQFDSPDGPVRHVGTDQADGFITRAYTVDGAEGVSFLLVMVHPAEGIAAAALWPQEEF